MYNFDQWNGFFGSLWKEEVNVRNFIQTNYTPYDGDECFTIKKSKLRGIESNGMICAEDEIGVLLRYIVEFGLRSIKESLPPQSARTDGNLRLVDIVSHARGIVLQSQQYHDAHLLVRLQLVDKHIA